MIDERTLTLYYFGDGLEERERREVEQALASDHLLAARYQALVHDLEALRAPADAAPAPEHLTHQWHDLVAREAQLERQRAPARGDAPRFPWLGLGTAFASVLALGIAIGVFMPRNSPEPGPELVGTENTTPTPPGSDSGATPPVSAEGAFERGLQVYLAESQGQLAGLGEQSQDEQAALVLQIVAQNRLFERAAEKQQAPEIARLMRAIEPILLRLAADDTTEQDADALRRQLVFELNAMLTKLQQPSSNEMTST